MPQARTDESTLQSKAKRPALKFDMLSSRAAFATLPPLSLPPPPVPLPQPSTPLRTPSRQVPRSPYITISPQRQSRTQDAPPRNQSPPPFADVFVEQDCVGEGLYLQGELIRTVPVPPRPGPPPLHAPAPVLEVVRKLGSGSYAVVYLARELLAPRPNASDTDLAFADDMDLDSPPAPAPVYGREFAIKCLSKADLDRDALAAQLFEATIHQALPPHPNIVTLYRTLETDSFLLLVLECVPGEDLFYFLEQARDGVDEQLHATHGAGPAVTPPTPSLLSSLHPDQLLSPHRLRLIASMFAQMCDAVASCHRVSVFHRDIKPENFIVTDGRVQGPDGRMERRVIVKLTDFGLATDEPESADMDCGSAPYMSYECRNNCAPTYSTGAADVWSLGIVLINMLYHHNPWFDTTAGACPSFEFFRAQPIPFFLQRFTGMTRPVAEFLATRVFCLLDTPGAERVSAEELGLWARHLPHLLSHSAAPPAAPVRAYFSPVASMPRSRRPSSRPVSLRGGGEEARPPLATNVEDEEPDDDGDAEDACSRSTSNARRRKRGQRKGKGAAAPPPDVPDLAQDLATASQVLAREISKTSRRSQSPAPPPPPKKPSKWKDLLRMSSSDAIGSSHPPPSSHSPPPPLPHGRPPTATAQNVSTLIMGLSPAPAKPGPRGVSPNSTRGRQGGGGGGGGASSSNWRTSSSASSMSGGSAYTRFSNGSVRSVSTVATSVSAASSWRAPDPTPAPTKKQKAPLPPPPANLKIISGVPWELNELPRGCHVRPNEHVFSPPPLRYTMKAQARAQAASQAQALDTITERERERTAANKSPAPPPPPDSPTASISDIEDNVDGPKKVQRGQINALAKMLSALKANRGAH